MCLGRQPLPAGSASADRVHLLTFALLFTAVTALLTGLLFGIVPAFQASPTQEAEALKSTGRSASGSKRAAWTLKRTRSLRSVTRPRPSLIGAGLLIRSFLHVLDVGMGFRAEHARAWRAIAGPQLDSKTKQALFYDRLTRDIEPSPA